MIHKFISLQALNNHMLAADRELEADLPHIKKLTSALLLSTLIAKHRESDSNDDEGTEDADTVVLSHEVEQCYDPSAPNRK